LHQKSSEEGGDKDYFLATKAKFKTPAEFIAFLDTDEGDYTISDNKNWEVLWSGDPSELE
jgi:hypothetical protein